MTRREHRALFHTGDDLSGVPWLVDADGYLVPESFCDTDYLEQAFNHDQAYYIRTIGTVNVAEMRQRLVDGPRTMHTDGEVLKDAPGDRPCHPSPPLTSPRPFAGHVDVQGVIFRVTPCTSKSPLTVLEWHSYVQGVPHKNTPCTNGRGNSAPCGPGGRRGRQSARGASPHPSRGARHQSPALPRTKTGMVARSTAVSTHWPPS